MPKYDIDAVGLECQAAYKVLTAAAKLSGNIDPERQKQHDDRFTKAMMVPVKEVKEYYEDFAERVAIFKKESKGAMDRIERTLKSKGSKLEPGDWKMLEQDRDTLIEYSTDFSKELKNQYSFLGAWRGDGWSRMLKDCTFSEGAHKLVDSVIKIRTHYMMMQATQWGPEMERINAYAARAQALLVAARKNAGSGGAGAEEFEKMRAALDDAWFAPGSKSGASTLAGKMSSQLSNAKQKIKAGKVDSGLTSHQQDTFDSTLAMGKTLRGAVKSLDILGKSVADMVKGSAKDKELGPKWVDLAKKIKTAQGEAAQAVKDHEEYEKILPKLVKLYKDYDAKKK